MCVGVKVRYEMAAGAPAYIRIRAHRAGYRRVETHDFVVDVGALHGSRLPLARVPGWKVAALPSICFRNGRAVGSAMSGKRRRKREEGGKVKKGSRQAMRGSARRGSEGSEPRACPRGLAGTSSPVHPGQEGALPPRWIAPCRSRPAPTPQAQAPLAEGSAPSAPRSESLALRDLSVEQGHRPLSTLSPFRIGRSHEPR
jgi:hypothetical protein